MWEGTDVLLHLLPETFPPKEQFDLTHENKTFYCYPEIKFWFFIKRFVIFAINGSNYMMGVLAQFDLT